MTKPHNMHRSRPTLIFQTSLKLEFSSSWQVSDAIPGTMRAFHFLVGSLSMEGHKSRGATCLFETIHFQMVVLPEKWGLVVYACWGRQEVVMGTGEARAGTGSENKKLQHLGQWTQKAGEPASLQRAVPTQPFPSLILKETTTSF